MAESDVTILYPCRTKMSDSQFGCIMIGFQTPTKEDLTKYVTVDRFKTVVGDDVMEYLESLFVRYNDPQQNPLSSKEKQKVIKENQTYTSMSVGSIVKINDDHWIAAGFGWKKLF